ncbi:MAG: 4-coumarate--CoA ligase [Caulobacteraceae bacterium]|nr:MAG: 4-coumarate--CoA ligase [Caulobacteraceae bacterium]
MSVADLFENEFHDIPSLVALHAAERPDHIAVAYGERSVTYREFNDDCDRVAAALQRDGVANRDVVAICALSSIEYMTTFVGALRAGVAVSPLAPSSTPESLVVMLDDCGAKLFFLDAGVAQDMAGVIDQVKARLIALDESDAGASWTGWLAPAGLRPEPVQIDRDQPFNIIYSSGTTGAPKGIVQPHMMRWQHVRRGLYKSDSVTLASTPLYSNTTLVSVFPTLAHGGTLVLMSKFDATKFLDQAQRWRATHSMLVPVQYKRLMEHPDFDRYDLSSYQMKTCTSAPFSAALKADVLKRWPGGLIEYFGMTEGGGTCVLECHAYPDKLGTVGRPAPGHDIRLIDEEGREAPQGEIGEIVGHSASLMLNYHNQPGKTAEAEWFSPEGKRFIRTGDVGRYDADGFLTLMDRKKDMIISGGFNVYPSDLEAVVAQHPDVAEVAVVGVPSDRWGETPVGFVALNPGAATSADDLRDWANGKLGKTQRLSDLQLVDALPRSHIGKVLKRELRDSYRGQANA